MSFQEFKKKYLTFYDLSYLEGRNYEIRKRLEEDKLRKKHLREVRRLLNLHAN